ncbi:MAG TPA: hypothetical protein VFS74_08975, partial [Gemmatimonadales bacterium]|nr:hypothetical protein [Gemmatimonadales bacterium]
ATRYHVEKSLQQYDFYSSAIAARPQHPGVGPTLGGRSHPCPIRRPGIGTIRYSLIFSVTDAASLDADAQG